MENTHKYRRETNPSHPICLVIDCGRYRDHYHEGQRIFPDRLGRIVI